MKREMRFQLTGRCNYRCFFCHHEGVDPLRSESHPTAPESAALLRELVTGGYDDITFTGGEPLLCRDELEIMLQELARLNAPPAITLVTNGSLWNDKTTAILAAYPGPKKVHFSIHSFDPVKYARITRQRACSLEKAIEAVRGCVAGGIPAKLNQVLLRRFNADAASLRLTLEKAADIGVAAVKFIELLVTRRNWAHFEYYRDIDSIKSSLGGELLYENGDLRRSRFLYKKAPGLKVELTRCTCKVGCAACTSVRDRTIGPDHIYHPCFVQESVGFSCRNGAWSEAFGKGDLCLEKYAERFGKDSPLLIAQDTFEKGRRDVYFSLPEQPAMIASELKEAGFEISKVRSFKTRYYLPVNSDPSWRACRKVMRIGIDTANPRRADLIYSDHAYVMHGKEMVDVVRFLDESGPVSFDDPGVPAKLLRRMGFRTWFSHDLKCNIYRIGEHVISVSMEGPAPNLLVSHKSLQDARVREAITRIGGKAIRVPFALWLFRKTRTRRRLKRVHFDEAERQILASIREEVTASFASHLYSSHHLDHTLRVCGLALKLAAGRPADPLVVRAAALLHDIGHLESGPERCHAARSVRIAAGILERYAIEESRKLLIRRIIGEHRYSTGICPDTIEGKIIQDADRLDALGATGLMRTVMHSASCAATTNASPDAGMHASIGHIRKKLLRLLAGFHTRRARRLAERRHRFLQTYLAELERENGEAGSVRV